MRPPKGHPGMWVAKRDVDMMRVNGYAVMPDLVYVPPENIVLEVDPARLHSQPIGLVTKPENIHHVSRHARTERSESNRLVRISDLVSLQEIVNRTNRTRKTIDDHKRLHAEDFPNPVITVGRIKLRLWSDVALYFKNKGLRVRLEGHKPRYRRKEDAFGNTG